MNINTEHHDQDGNAVAITGQERAILRFFEYEHLPPHLSMVSREFSELAHVTAYRNPGSDETMAALRKLLEAKDAAVRARLELEG